MKNEKSFLDVDMNRIDGTEEIELIDLLDEDEVLIQENKNSQKVIYFDLETQVSFDEVQEKYGISGWSTEGVKKMKMSVGSIYIEPDGVFKSYTEDQVEQLVDELFSADVVVGFNVIGFDYVVLMGYTDRDFSQIPTIDMLIDVKEQFGHRLKLDGIAKASLVNVSKSADGLAALRWFKEGKIDEIRKYCEQDVAVTRDVYKYGVDNKSIKFDGKYGVREKAINWTVKQAWDLEQIRKLG
jgi:DEAD/DEAH box helicase domain-containing protein